MSIIKDGSIEGWFVVLCETVMVFGLLAAGFFITSVRDAWPTMGPYIQTIYPLAMGTWFAYKTVKSF
jgi:hypothetical protein